MIVVWHCVKKVERALHRLEKEWRKRKEREQKGASWESCGVSSTQQTHPNLKVLCHKSCKSSPLREWILMVNPLPLSHMEWLGIVISKGHCIAQSSPMSFVDRIIHAKASFFSIFYSIRKRWWLPQWVGAFSLMGLEEFLSEKFCLFVCSIK